MVRPKIDPADDFKNWLKQSQEAFEAKKASTPIVATRWYVAEHTPAYRSGDEYSDFWVDAKTTKVSVWFETEAEAVEWADKHLPDNSNGKLLVKHQNRRVITTEEWVNW